MCARIAYLFFLNLNLFKERSTFDYYQQFLNGEKGHFFPRIHSEITENAELFVCSRTNKLLGTKSTKYRNSLECEWMRCADYEKKSFQVSHKYDDGNFEPMWGDSGIKAHKSYQIQNASKWAHVQRTVLVA